MATSKLKRFICFITILVCTFVLFSCGKDDNNDILSSIIDQQTNKYDNSYQVSSSVDNIRDGKILKRDDKNTYNNILEELNALDQNKVTDEYRQDLSKRMDALGYDYTWNADNSLTIRSGNEVVTYGKTVSWPSTAKYVNLLPAPINGTVKDYEESESTLINMNWTKDDALSYVDLLKQKGFKYDIKTAQLSNTYTYTAKNLDSYQVSVAYSSTYSTIEIEYVEPIEGVSYEWPTSGLALLLPTVSFGESIKVEKHLDDSTDEENSVKITVSPSTTANFESYVDLLKQKGFNKAIETLDLGSTLSYKAFNSDYNRKVSVSYSMNIIIIEIKIEEGTPVSSDWPKEGLGSYLPESFSNKNYKVTANGDGEKETSVKIEVSNVSAEEGKEYLELLKQTFIYGTETNDGGSYFTFKAYHQDKDKFVECSCAVSRLIITISYKKYQEPENNELPKEGIIELIPLINFGTVYEANIKETSMEIKINDVTLDQANNYIAQVKECGYINNESGYSFGSMVFYLAYGEKESRISVYYTGSQLQISFEAGNLEE